MRVVDSERQTEGFGGVGVGGWLSLVVGIKEGTYCMEHWVCCINSESWNTGKMKQQNKTNKQTKTKTGQ